MRASALSDAAPSKTLLYQLAVGCALLLAAAVGLGEVSHVAFTRVAWASLLFQGVVVSFASYLAWFWLLRRYLASRVAVFSFMTPLFGVSFGVLVLREPVDGWFGAGAALVLLGITLVSAPSRVPKEAPAATPPGAHRGRPPQLPVEAVPCDGTSDRASPPRRRSHP
ncbi:DMT family transporter [Anaeromyxobacter diazotrophicus]|uniref:EamA domain-containing protein n=1 Tax=Anaeromyxobacter diazotrophicus TaxID=2590199 RepID=A0A7I9VGP8_9BACT|nr:DMT family transporter [Anaeromyxobacter diazotrophicus]GEJ55419.1 hypothetical protein AMYX_01600 [Anaeromyxobacter diazotrophicus]